MVAKLGMRGGATVLQAMFRKKEDSEQRKVRLPKRNAAPTVEYLQFIFNQCFQYRGQEVEVIWSEQTSTRQFSLIARAESGKDYAHWILWEDNGRELRQVWSYDTHDIEVINNMISMLETTPSEFSSTETGTQRIQPLAKPTSPYRQLFAASYTGVTSAPSSLRDSLTGIPSAYQNPSESLRLNTLSAATAFDSSAKGPKISPLVPSPLPSPPEDQSSSLSPDIKEQLKLLQRAGLGPQALIVKKQDNLGSSELKLLLTKNCEGDVSAQILLYQQLNGRFTLTRFLTDHPMGESLWVPMLFNYFVNGLITIEQPVSSDAPALDFLREAKPAIQALHKQFIRPETGIFSYPGLLYFLQYEFLRFQVYDYPLGLIIFEMNKRSLNAIGGLDLINKEETLIALSRIAAINRPLDLLAHFETIAYALLLPNTTGGGALQIAQRMLEALSNTPLTSELDSKLLKLSFGIAAVPSHCKDMESLVRLAKQALQKAKSGDLTIVQADKSP